MNRGPTTVDFAAGGALLLLLDLDPAAAGIDVVIAGHSHQPLIEQREGVLYLNPGSAGRRRFKLPISLALLDIEDGQPRAQLVTLG